MSHPIIILAVIKNKTKSEKNITTQLEQIYSRTSTYVWSQSSMKWEEM